MPVRKRHPRVETVGITVSAEAKQFIESEAATSDLSVSELLRPGLILALVQNYLGLSLEEAIARLIHEEVSYEDIVKYLNGGDGRTAAELYQAAKRRVR